MSLTAPSNATMVGISEIQDAISARNNQDSLLLRLPAELRNHIYEYVLGGITWLTTWSGVTCIKENAQKDSYKVQTTEDNYGALLRVSRQIYSETSALPSSLSSFRCVSQHVQDFCLGLTATQKSAMNSMEFRLRWDVSLFWEIAFKSMDEDDFEFIGSLPGLKHVQVHVTDEGGEDVRHQRRGEGWAVMMKEDVVAWLYKALKVEERPGIKFSIEFEPVRWLSARERRLRQ